MNTIPAGILQSALMREDLLRVLLPLTDETYSAPRSDWLLKDFSVWYKDVLNRLGAGTYLAEAQDCDDFADSFKVFAAICHRRTGVKTALSVGVMHYFPREMTGHAINIALTSDKGIIYIEPQTGNMINLTEKEKKSACLVRF